jgi:exodeoxyribonuclease VII small subunit
LANKDLDMADARKQPAIDAMSFEEALTELQALVKALEKGDAKLEEAIASYERGAALKRHCEKKLREAQEKVDKIVVGADGGLSTQAAKLD